MLSGLMFLIINGWKMKKLTKHSLALAACVAVGCVLWHVAWQFGFGHGADIVIRGRVLNPDAAVRTATRHTSPPDKVGQQSKSRSGVYSVVTSLAM